MRDRRPFGCVRVVAHVLAALTKADAQLGPFIPHKLHAPGDAAASALIDRVVNANDDVNDAAPTSAPRNERLRVFHKSGLYYSF